MSPIKTGMTVMKVPSCIKWAKENGGDGKYYMCKYDSTVVPGQNCKGIEVGADGKKRVKKGWVQCHAVTKQINKHPSSSSTNTQVVENYDDDVAYKQPSRGTIIKYIVYFVVFMIMAAILGTILPDIFLTIPYY